MNGKVFGYCVIENSSTPHVEKYYFIFADVPRCGDFVKIYKTEYEIIRIVHELNIEDNSPIVKVVLK